VFQKACHRTVSWYTRIRTIPSHTVSLMSILILSSRLRLGIPRAIVPSGYPIEILYSFFMRTTCSSHLIHLYLITLLISGEEYNYVILSILRLLPVSGPRSILYCGSGDVRNGTALIVKVNKQNFCFYCSLQQSRSKSSIHNVSQWSVWLHSALRITPLSSPTRCLLCGLMQLQRHFCEMDCE
jgi:hypothetical protein